MIVLKVLVLPLLFSAVAAAQIPDLCNTGETPRTILGCTGVLVTPNPPGGGPNRDDNWRLVFPYPSLNPDACALSGFVGAWVDTPNAAWLPNNASTVSEWITSYDGEGYIPLPGWYVYRTVIHVPSLLPGGGAPTGVVFNGRLASDNATYGFYMRNLADNSCAVVTGLPVPINPDGGPQFTQWSDFSFTNPIAITPGSDLVLYVLVENEYDSKFLEGRSSTGFRIEFLGTSTFQ